MAEQKPFLALVVKIIPVTGLVLFSLLFLSFKNAGPLAQADDPPTVSATISPENPTSTQSVVFRAIASDDVGVNKVEILIDENNDSTFEVRRACSPTPCSTLSLTPRGPYALNQILNYMASSTDSAGHSVETPRKTLKIFDVSAAHSPQYPTSSDVTEFTFSVTGAYTKFALYIDDSNDAIYESSTCASPPCTVNRAYLPGQFVKYYAEATDAAGRSSRASGSFTIFDLEVNHRVPTSLYPTLPSSSDQVTFTATVADATAAMQNIHIVVDDDMDGVFDDLIHSCPQVKTCSVTGGPYPRGKTISYFAIAADSSNAQWLEPKSFVIFDIDVNHSPNDYELTHSIKPVDDNLRGIRRPTHEDNVTFTAFATSSVGISTNKLTIHVDENNDGIYEVTQNCSLRDCALIKGSPYARGQIIHYYATVEDRNGVTAATLPAKSFVVSNIDIPLNASFNASTTGLRVKLTNITDLASTTISSWAWNFGDSTTNSTQNPPVKTYGNPGVYEIKLTVTGTAGGRTYTDIATTSIAVTSSVFPDDIAPLVSFVAPEEGAPRRPGFTVKYNAIDNATTSSCALETKNGGDIWRDKGHVPCGAGAKTFIGPDWCETRGTKTCGVRITATDVSDANSTLATRTGRGERWFSIDTTPPSLLISSNTSAPTSDTRTVINFQASDEYGIVEKWCLLNNGSRSTIERCTPERIYSGLADGFRTFMAVAIDNAGNATTKNINWEIDSIKPTTFSVFRKFPDEPTTYFSENLQWNVVGEDGSDANNAPPVVQYDIRYSVEPILTEDDWVRRTGKVYFEHAFVPPIGPTSSQRMLIGPDSDENIKKLSIGGLSNRLPSYTSLYFAIRARDEKWNWSDLPSNISTTTLRDPCDYDADRIYTPKDGCRPNAIGDGPNNSTECNPATQTCDLYDNPADWTINGSWTSVQTQDYQTPDGYKWIRLFGNTIRDLDFDKKNVARGRVAMTGGRTGFPDPRNTDEDWYDNPFTSDLRSRTNVPKLAQLSYAFNDLDLDGFVPESWKTLFAGPYPTEPDIKDLFPEDGSRDGGGCVYYDALEDECLDCTAYVPNPATGRVPPYKTTVSDAKNKAVCQIEAYYSDLRERSTPYEIIPLGGLQKGTLDYGKSFLTASAQCRDTVDNNLNGLRDSGYDPEVNEINCPADPSGRAPSAPSQNVVEGVFDVGGLVQCGRYADDFTTPIDESAPCGICHFFYLFDNIMDFVMWRLMLMVILLAVVWGGFLILTSRGSIERVLMGKKVIRIAFLAYAITLISWTLLNTFFMIGGFQDWTGFTPVRGKITDITSSTSIKDDSKSWEADRWEDYIVEIQPPKSPKILQINTGGRSSSILIGSAVSWQDDQWNGFQILVTNGDANGEIRTVVDTQAPSTLVLDRELVGLTALNDKLDILDFEQPIIRAIAGNNGNTLNLASGIPPFVLTTNTKYTYHIAGTGWWSFACQLPQAPKAFFAIDPKFITGLTSDSAKLSTNPLTFDFTDFSQGAVFSWNWNFGGAGSLQDTTTVTSKSPRYSYTGEGRYPVTLTVRNSGGTDTKTGFVDFAPDPSFTAVPQHGEVPLTVTFTDATVSRGSSPDTWEWDFNGDDVIDAAGRGPHTYTYYKPGPYVVKLITTGAGGMDRKVATNYSEGYVFAYNSPPAPVAAFDYEIIPDTMTVRFINKSFIYTPKDNITSWLWDFDNGNTSTVESPIYHFAPRATPYNVTLTATGPGGKTDSANQTITFLPTANAEADKTNGALGADGKFTVEITDMSTGTISGVKIQFGDSTASSTVLGGTVEHVYARDGAFNVTVTATTTGQPDSVKTLNDYIKIAPYADLSFNAVTLTLDSRAQTQIQRIPQVGCSNPNNCAVTDCTLIDGCTVGQTGATVRFNNDSLCPSAGCSYYWQFGDGAISTASSPSRAYVDNEDYIVQLTTLSAGGGSNTIVKRGTSPSGTGRKEGYIHIAPYANFDTRYDSLATSATHRNPTSNHGSIFPLGKPLTFNVYSRDTNVQFRNSSLFPKLVDPDYVHVPSSPVAGFKWEWDFGDGSAVSNTPEPDKNQNYPDRDGRYTVSLKAVSLGGQFKEVKDQYVVFPPVAILSATSIPVDNRGYAEDEPVRLTANDTAATVGKVEKWGWDFSHSNPGPSTTTAPTNTKDYTFNQAPRPSFAYSDYAVILNATSAGWPHPDGLHTRVYPSHIRVYKQPVANFRATGFSGDGYNVSLTEARVTKDETATFTASTTASEVGTIDTFTWRFTGTTAGPSAGNPISRTYSTVPSDGIDYDVILNVRGPGGPYDGGVGGPNTCTDADLSAGCHDKNSKLPKNGYVRTFDPPEATLAIKTIPETLYNNDEDNDVTFTYTAKDKNRASISGSCLLEYHPSDYIQTCATYATDKTHDYGGHARGDYVATSTAINPARNKAQATQSFTVKEYVCCGQTCEYSNVDASQDSYETCGTAATYCTLRGPACCNSNYQEYSSGYCGGACDPAQCRNLHIDGCTDSGACNYDSTATRDDGTCFTCTLPETCVNKQCVSPPPPAALMTPMKRLADRPASGFQNWLRIQLASMRDLLD